MFAGVDLSTWVVLILAGCVSGFASGLLGIGGGTIIVPAMVFILPLFDIGGDELPKIAMATALALVIPTAISGATTHASRNAVDWGLLLLITPSLMAGAYLASSYVALIPTFVLVTAFVIFAGYSAWKLIQPATKSANAGAGADAGDHETPNAWLLLKTFIGGAASSLLGFGVGYFAVPLLSRFIPIQRAIGTASALAIPMALSGVVGYLIAGSPEGCHARCTGYVFFPAVAAVGMSAVMTAPVGAWVSHALPLATVRRIFAGFLVFAAANMVYKSLPEHPLDINVRTVVATAMDTASGARNGPVASEAPQWIGGEKETAAAPAPDRLPSQPATSTQTAPVATPAPATPAPTQAVQSGTPIAVAIASRDAAAMPPALPYQSSAAVQSTPRTQPAATSGPSTTASTLPERKMRRPIATPVEDDPALAMSALAQFYSVPTLPGMHLWIASGFTPAVDSDNAGKPSSGAERKLANATSDISGEITQSVSKPTSARRNSKQTQSASRKRRHLN